MTHRHDLVQPRVSPMRVTTWQKALLAGEILRAYLLVRRVLVRGDLPSAVKTLRTVPRRTLRPLILPDPVGDGLRLANAVMRTLAVSESASKCLTRSLVLLRLLARRGGHGALIIAVLPAEDSPLDAHAWVEVNGEPLLVPAPGYGRLLTL